MNDRAKAVESLLELDVSDVTIPAPRRIVAEVLQAVNDDPSLGVTPLQVVEFVTSHGKRENKFGSILSAYRGSAKRPAKSAEQIARSIANRMVGNASKDALADLF